MNSVFQTTGLQMSTWTATPAVEGKDLLFPFIFCILSCIPNKVIQCNCPRKHFSRTRHNQSSYHSHYVMPPRCTLHMSGPLAKYLTFYSPKGWPTKCSVKSISSMDIDFGKVAKCLQIQPGGPLQDRLLNKTFYLNRKQMELWIVIQSIGVRKIEMKLAQV